MKPKSANETKGTLIVSDGDVFFRVYKSNYTFTDYRLCHNDLTVTINDPDAFFYKYDEEHILDHSPQTLGYIDEA